VVPHANPDGAARNPLAHECQLDEELMKHCTFGTWEDGSPVEYADSKAYFPMPIERMKRIGSYFNDNGVNLVLDNVFSSDAQPENRALADLYLSEKPDCVVLSHNDAGSLVGDPLPFLPPGVQTRQAQLGAIVGFRFYKEGRFRHRIPLVGPGEAVPSAFSQFTVPHYVCGAVPLMIEFPGGVAEDETLDVLLDYGLDIHEELFTFGNAYSFRPEPPQWEYHHPGAYTGKPRHNRGDGP